MRKRRHRSEYTKNEIVDELGKNIITFFYKDATDLIMEHMINEVNEIGKKYVENYSPNKLYFIRKYYQNRYCYTNNGFRCNECPECR